MRLNAPCLQVLKKTIQCEPKSHASTLPSCPFEADDVDALDVAETSGEQAALYVCGDAAAKDAKSIARSAADRAIAGLQPLVECGAPDSGTEGDAAVCSIGSAPLQEMAAALGQVRV